MIFKKEYQVNIETLKEKLENANKILPSTCRIGVFLASMAVIDGKFFSNHPKILNHVHKDSNDLVSVIITLGGGGYNWRGHCVL